MHGTGFMVTDDMLMTAGHCVWDWDNNKPASILCASFGYHDESGQWDEHRYGRVVLMSNYREHNMDFAFVHLTDRRGSFTGVPIRPFRWYDTPLRGTEFLYITGYPKDRDARCNTMFEGGKWVSWDLISESGKLRHQISTFQGY